ncbi:hypothetical protein SDRG_00768 [Saprolegnia diclina VS20]|uniref:ABC transporter domain-containing protein n=1 Tax=Saprolegnia diclina (strain VS20) TaxID=1156394 RepID=T0S9A7_SAPDV|nr:hypothetical protein SDRG_00768 [Saprolegnia diclina VS20]EQC41913.1 hypothetical protein SDRG_00768 [Saprolegnia diclina VS20]|eukprot:XP_008604482.1 hypothetical protein SDRG_00768 [Saprolegnia diclina VS20]
MAHAADTLLKDGSDSFHATLAAQLEASLGKTLPQLEIRFQDLAIAADMAVATKDGHELPTLLNDVTKGVMGLFSAKRSIRKDILHPMTGVFKPRTTTLVLGQPGSGKSSLMKLLSGRFPMEKNISIGGHVTYNGAALEVVGNTLPQFASYVSQRDFNYASLTVKETLAFGHACSGGAAVPPRLLDSLTHGSPDENAQAKAVIQSLYHVYPDIITRQMGLKICEDTIVGNGMLRGVSGGERKRVTVGEMEFGMKMVSFMDEISTGLDSAATFDIVKAQKGMAASLKKTIVIALLQPSPEVYNLFDDVLLLNEGHVMYHGPRATCLAYFESLGFKCPLHRDVADFLLDLGTPEQDQYLVAHSIDAHTPRTPAEYASVFKESAIFAAMLSHLAAPTDPVLVDAATSHLATLPAYRVPFGASTKALVQRQVMVFLRNREFVVSRIIMVLVMAFLYSTSFYQVNADQIIMVLGVIFMTVLFLALGQLPMIPAIVEAREIFYKQKRANFFRTSSFILAQCTTQVPFAFLETILFGSVMYWVTGFTSSVGAFLTYLLLLYVTNLAFTTWFFFLASISPNLNVAQPVSMVSVLFYILFSGFVMSSADMPDYLVWIYWIDPLAWCIRALAINQYSASEFQTILLNGYPATDLAIRRSTGYCEQMDIHSEAATFREAFQFSAMLRQSDEIPEADKLAFAEECLELLDMKHLGDKIIRGASVEQMKRLTIGVELAAAPSVLFLDEPTSGLDARSAKIIMTGIRKIASTGRTVVCTIHQPSAEVFEMFDSLLLLKRGGETVFFGDLGAKASHLIEYFQAIPDTPALSDEANPATWMLEVIGAGVESKNAHPKDYVQIFNASEERRNLTASLAIHANVHPSLPELTFANKRAASSSTQFKMVTQRFFRVYWRTPSYCNTRIFISIFLAVLFGLVFRVVDFTTFSGATGGVGMIFLTSIFVGLISFNSVIPLAGEERASFYRERAAQTYNSLWYFVGATLVEIPYSIVSTFVFTAIYYPFVGLNESVGACVYYGFNLTLMVLMNVYMGQMMAYAMPSIEVATLAGILLNSIFFLFMGVTPIASEIPSGYRWLYTIVPPKYSVAILTSQTLAKCTGDKTQLGCQTLKNVPPSLLQQMNATSITVKEFIEFTYEMYYDDALMDILVVVGCIFFFRLLALLALRYINHTKR